MRSVHELSICQALLSQVTAIARERGAEAIERIVLEIGPLSGVDAVLLARAFEVARAGSCAADADLAIEEPTVTVSCVSCGARHANGPQPLAVRRLRRISDSNRRRRRAQPAPRRAAHARAELPEHQPAGAALKRGSTIMCGTCGCSVTTENAP